MTTVTTCLNRRRGASLLLAVLIALALVTPSALAAPGAQGTAVLRIGYLGVMNADTATGAQLAIDQINAAGGFTGADGNQYQLELVVLAAPPTAESLAADVTALTTQNVVALLGPDSSTVLSPDNITTLVNTGLPVLTAATVDTLTDGDADDVIFRTRAPETVYSEALAAYMLDDLALTSFGLVQTDIESTEALLDFENFLQGRGVVPAAKIQLPDATGLADEFNTLVSLNPEAVVMWGPEADAAILLRMLRDGGWTGQFAYRMADEAARSNRLKDVLADGVLGVNSWSYAYPGSAARVFLHDYITTFGQVPGPLAVAAYDAVWYLRAVMRTVGVDAESIRTGLVNGVPQDLVAGTLRPQDFGNGDLIRMAIVYQLQAGGGPSVVALYNSGDRVLIEDAGN